MNGSPNYEPAGKTGSDAYREAVSNKSRNADVNGSQLASQPGVRERIEELKAESAKKCSMTRAELIESLVAMYRSAPDEASLDNPLCDSLISRGVRHAVFPTKTAIAAQLSKLTGWDTPTKIEVEAGTELATFLDGLFAGGGTLGSGSGNGGGDNGEHSKEASGSAASRR